MVFERLAKPWGAILSGFDSQSLRHLMEACDNWLVGLSRIQVRGNPLGVRVAPLPPFGVLGQWSTPPDCRSGISRVQIPYTPPFSIGLVAQR